MPGGGDDLSMFKTVELHDDLINKDILPRLEKVEASQEEIKSEIKAVRTDVASIRNAQGSLELTVLKDGAQTRDILLNRFVDHYLDSDGKQLVTREKVTLMKLGTKEKVSLAVIAMLSGGGLATVTTFLLNIYTK